MTQGTTIAMHRLTETIGVEVIGVDADTLLKDDGLASEVLRTTILGDKPVQ